MQEKNNVFDFNVSDWEYLSFFVGIHKFYEYEDANFKALIYKDGDIMVKIWIYLDSRRDVGGNIISAICESYEDAKNKINKFFTSMPTGLPFLVKSSHIEEIKCKTGKGQEILDSIFLNPNVITNIIKN